MKIAYVYSTMATTGGTERMITEKVNYLSERYGYDITIITCFQLPNEENYFKLSNNIKQINLGIPYFSQYKYKYPKRLWIRWKLNRYLRKSIIQSVNQINPDILIGVALVQAFQTDLACSLRIVGEQQFGIDVAGKQLWRYHVSGSYSNKAASPVSSRWNAPLSVDISMTSNGGMPICWSVKS